VWSWTFSDRIVVQDLGRKIAEGDPYEVRSNPQVIGAYWERRLRQAGQLEGEGVKEWRRARHSPDCSCGMRSARSSQGRHAGEGPRHLADLQFGPTR